MQDDFDFRYVVKRFEEGGLTTAQALHAAEILNDVRLKFESRLSKAEAQIEAQGLFIKFLAVLVVALFFLFALTR